MSPAGGSDPAPGRRPRLGLVIGSGALKCAASLGLLKVLARERIEIGMVVGCSGGSIFATALALGWSVERTAGELQQIWSGLFARVSYRSVVRALFPRLLPFDGRFGLIDDRALNGALSRLCGDATFADARLPLYIVATDLLSGEKVVLSEGRLFDALRGSVAIPFAFTPWMVGGRTLMDGGASDPLPIDVAVKEGADIILAMGFENPAVDAIGTLAGLVFQTSSITVTHLLRSTFAFYSMAHHAEVIPFIPAFDRPVGLRDAHLIPYLIDEGEKVAEQELPYLRRLLAAEDLPMAIPG